MADEFSEVIPLGEWLPDRAALDSGGATMALNVISDVEDYRPCNSFAGLSLESTDRALEAYDHLASNGTVTKFIASRTKLYRYDGVTRTRVDVSRTTGGAYITPVDGSWHFWQFGDRVIATNYVDDVQTYLVGTDTTFKKLITSGPNIRARNGGVINNFNVFIDVFDDQGQTPNAVRWSPINDPAGNYTPSQATQSDRQICVDGNPGPGMAVIGGQNYGILVFKNAIYRMEYVGPPAVFKFTMMVEGIGAINDHAVTGYGSSAIMRSEDGFYLFDGSKANAIGHGKVDNWFKENMASDYAYNMRSVTDPANKTALFSYTSTNSTDKTNDRTLIYNYADNRFTLKNETSGVLFRGFTQGFTLDQIGALFPNIETVPYSFDSRYWQGGASTLGGIDSNGVLGFYTGTPMTAYVESQEVRLNKNGMSFVDAVVPVFEGGTSRVRLGSRNNQNSTVKFTPYQIQNSGTEEVNFFDESRYHRVGIEVSGIWKHVQGVRIKAIPTSGI